MKRGFFVTGTDTNIGKTVVAAALVSALREKFGAVRYWKPIQTGIENDDDTAEVKRLANCADDEIFAHGYRLEKPLSPHLSARLANTKIEISEILRLFNDADDQPWWIIEGAGGVFVPLNDDEMMIDLIKLIDLPVIIAARSGLGTINHTLLTVAALRAANVKIAGVILNGDPNDENAGAIAHHGQVEILSELPTLENLNFDNLKIWAASFNARNTTFGG